MPAQWALHPLRFELDRMAGGPRPVVMDEASILAGLDSQELAVGLLSPLWLLRNPNLEIALSAGLLVRGASGSTLMGFQGSDVEGLKLEIKKRIRALQEIFLHANVAQSVNLKSAVQFICKAAGQLALPRLRTAPRLRCGSSTGTPMTLARVFYRLLFGESAFETNEMIAYGHGGLLGDVSDVQVDILAGNDALARRGQYAWELDLGDLWFQLTGLPLVVYAALKNARSVAPLPYKSKILQSLELAQARMKIEPSAYLPDVPPVTASGRTIDLASYWKHLGYRLGAEELKGLRLFLQLALPLEKRAIDEEQLSVKMLRWQERERIAGTSL